MIRKLLLLLFMSGAMQAASEKAIDDLINHPMVQEIFAQARLHTNPELADCGTLKCIEKLLYREEEEVYEKIATQCDDQCYMDSYRVRTPFDYRMDPVGVHDEACVGDRLMHFTKKYLRQSGIDPQRVSIGCYKEYFKDEPETPALVRTTSGMACPIIAFNVEHPGLRDAQHYTSAHEVTHIVEKHGLKKSANHTRYFWYGHDAFASRVFKADFLALDRMHEKQADLFPLLRFGDNTIYKEILVGRILECLKQSTNGTLNTQWHKSAPDATHPGCSELLPYILQIEKIKTTQRAHNKAPVS